MKHLKRILIITVALFVASCDLNKLDNPSLLPASSADPALLLNGVQINFADFFYNLSDGGMQVSRQIHMYGPIYNNWFTPSYYNYLWQSAYANILVNTASISQLASAKGWYQHSAMAKTFQALTALAITDFFGDVPYLKALDPNNFNPAADKSQDVYAAALALLDDAVADFGKGGPAPNDLYYGGNKDNWLALINTLKLKVALNKRWVDAAGAKSTINALLSSNLIDAADGSEDFVYQYSTNLANPDSRHPYFTGNYLAGAGTYHSNWLMWNMRYGKKSGGTDIIDPRIRYYYYRQTNYIDTNDPNLTNVLPCNTSSRPARYATNSNWPFCIIKNTQGGNEGYWGRDYGDASGVGPDTKSRTNWGVYPIGGRYDDNSFSPTSASDGLKGAGIAPIMLASYVDFMKAEAALTLGTTGDAGALLHSAVSKSITKVMSFGESATGGSSTVPSSTDVQNYLTAVDALYTAASSTDSKLEVISKEYWIAAFGNGLETYNMYRRTGGKPSDMQIALRDPGQFPNTMPYPLNYSTQNNTFVAKDFSTKVFWDAAPNSKVN
jgi:hypothetical protein